MRNVCRVLALGATLAAIGVYLTFSVVWGNQGRDKELKDWRRGDGKTISPARDGGPFAEELERNRFLDRPLVSYRTPTGEQLFALQVQPKLADAPALPKDYLVLIDTSASMARGGLAAGLQLVDELTRRLGPDDRVAIWTANLKPRDVTRGFKSGKELDSAIKELVKEVPLGAADLGRTLRESLASLEVKAGRRRAVLYLGDGKSVAQPLDVDGRAALCEEMNRKQSPFFAVPLGLELDAQNLHSLVSGTGGTTLRTGPSELPATFIVRLQQDVSEPVCYPERFRLPATVTASLPARLPPLRRDASTLVVGKLAAGTETLDYELSGEVQGKTQRLDGSVKVAGADPENCFLVSVFEQWKLRKDRPALLQGDRALAYAHKQNQLAVEDLLAKAEIALEENQLGPAQRLFEQAEGLDPASVRARGGLVLVEKMRAGKKTRQDMLKELQLNAAKREVVRLKGGGRTAIEVLDDGDERADEPRAADDPARRDPLDDFKARRAIAEQQTTAVVNEAIRQANRVVRSSPDEAYELLKRTLEGVRTNLDLEPWAVVGLSGRLSRAMEGVKRVGDIVKRDQAEALALRAAADARLDLRNAERVARDRVRERMRIFHNLMDQAREDEAQRQALLMREEMVNRGLPVPQAVTAAYQTAQSRYHLKEVQEMRRLREDRFLATMLEVERSHVPFSDEPPVEFPSSAIIRRLTRNKFDNWSDWSKYRVERYSVSSFGSDNPGRLVKMRDLMSIPIDRYGGLDDPKTTLVEALDQLQKAVLSKLPGGREVVFDINEKAFKYEMLNDVLKTEVANPTPIPPMEHVTAAMVLKRILARIPVPSGATYVLRPGTIEITTGQFVTAEKAIRVYPVADLVTPFPNAFNPQAVGQTAGIAGTFGGMGLAGGGVPLGAFNPMLGGMGGMNPLLGGMGGMNPLLGGGINPLLGGGINPLLGGVGGINPLLGGVGGINPLLGGVGGINPLLGGAGGLNGMGLAGVNGNLGPGGPFGNFGGQFGMQGGTQDQLLITLIRQVVGRPGDWAPQYNPITGMPLNPLDDERTEGVGQIAGQDNNLGYYPPALALVVKGPSMMHTRGSNLVITGAAGAAPGMAAAGGGGKVLVNGKEHVQPNKAANGEPLDPRTVWQDALARGVNDPGLIIAAADYLAGIGRFDHAAEFLKANLRQGIVVKPWVFQSLAVALRESGGSAEEIERAEVSAADLEPFNASGYLVAARALAEDRNYERALAFCRQAAELEPNVPHAYADAARYAEIAKDSTSMTWAVGHLLRQDWPVRNQELQQNALEKLESLARRVDRPAAEQLRREVTLQRRRDLVVKLLWQGEADLDLKVHEPSGSLCTPLARQTVGGGTLIADAVSEGMNAETYVAAEAFSGDYVVLVERVWGKPLGNKVLLRITRHQGTAEESEQLVTVSMVSNISEPIKVKLDGGRRTETVHVPPPVAHQPIDDGLTGLDSSDQVLTKLRFLADPELTSIETGMQGAVLSSGRPIERGGRPATKAHENDRTLYQNRVSSFVANSMELTAQAVLAADRQSIRLSLNPVYNPAAANKPARVVSPIFPGAGK